MQDESRSAAQAQSAHSANGKAHAAMADEKSDGAAAAAAKQSAAKGDGASSAAADPCTEEGPAFAGMTLIEDEPNGVFASVARSQFHQHVVASSRVINDAYDQFDVEMEVLNELSADPGVVQRIYTPPQALWKKNRYMNVLCFQDTRVLLSRDGNDEHTEYINASHIRRVLPGSRLAYVATQAPTESSVDDFWRMVWEQRSLMILMLTKEIEKDSHKADRYWPSSVGKSEQFGRLVVTLNSQTVDGDLVIRSFRLQRLKSANEKVAAAAAKSAAAASESKDASAAQSAPANESREVIHMQYRGWPDHGVPHEYSSLLHLFEVWRKSRCASIKHAAPPIIHCSAGIGRTGTFIALDMLLDYLNRDRLQREKFANPPVNVFNLVKALREQRPGMVQTKHQYAFVSLFLDHCLSKSLLGV